MRAVQLFEKSLREADRVQPILIGQVGCLIEGAENSWREKTLLRGADVVGEPENLLSELLKGFSLRRVREERRIAPLCYVSEDGKKILSQFLLETLDPARVLF